MNAITMLKEDHDNARKLMDELEKDDRTRRQDPPFDDEHWAAKFRVTKENVEHHIEEEEGEMFKLVRQEL